MRSPFQPTDIASTLSLLNSSESTQLLGSREPRRDCIRCAVVGNGGILNGSRQGPNIDAHDYVFRYAEQGQGGGGRSRGRKEEGRGAGRRGEELSPMGASSMVWAGQQPQVALQLLRADRHGHRPVQTDMPQGLRGRKPQDRCAHGTVSLRSGGVGAGAAVGTGSGPCSWGQVWRGLGVGVAHRVG